MCVKSSVFTAGQVAILSHTSSFVYNAMNGTLVYKSNSYSDKNN